MTKPTMADIMPEATPPFGIEDANQAKPKQKVLPENKSANVRKSEIPTRRAPQTDSPDTRRQKKRPVQHTPGRTSARVNPNPNPNRMTPSRNVHARSPVLHKSARRRVQAGWEEERTLLLPDMNQEQHNKDTVWLEIEGLGKMIRVTGFPFRIGRLPNCQLRFRGNRSISREHAQVIRLDSGYAVEDVKSLNGVKVNGHLVNRVMLNHGDGISIGNVTLRFHGQNQDGVSDAQLVSPRKSSRRKLSKEGVKKSLLSLVRSGAVYWTAIAATALLVMVGIYKVMVSDRVFTIPNEQIVVTAPVPAPTPTVKQQRPLQTDTGYRRSEPAAPRKTELATRVRNTPPVKASAAAKSSIPVTPKTVVQKAPVVAVNTETPKPAPRTKAVVAKPVKKASKPAPRKKPLVVKTNKPKRTTLGKAKPRPVHTNSPDNGFSQETGRTQLAGIDSRTLITRARSSYLAGNFDEAMQTLHGVAFSNRHRAQYRDEAKRLSEQLMAVHTNYEKGVFAFDEGDHDAGFQAWATFLHGERGLFPDHRSAYGQNVLRKVVGEYLRLGNQAKQDERWHDAYHHWQKAMDIEPDGEAARQLSALDREAQGIYRQAYRMETVNLHQATMLWKKVLDLVPPGTNYHTKASSKLSWYASVVN